MKESLTSPTFQKRSAEYFDKKAKEAKGTGKLLVALEMSNYLREARRFGLSFEELEKSGFKFATLPNIPN